MHGFPRVLSPFEAPSPFVGVHLDGRKWTGTSGISEGNEGVVG